MWIKIRILRVKNKKGDIKKYYENVDNQIIEIKGFYDEGAKIKSEQNPDIKVLLYNDLKPMIDYVIEKYGNKFWEILYE